jgi:hypothetical protein
MRHHQSLYCPLYCAAGVQNVGYRDG